MQSIFNRLSTLNSKINNTTIPSLIMIHKVKNSNEWAIDLTYYKNGGTTKRKTIYVADYQEYLDKIDEQLKLENAKQPHTIIMDRPCVILDDICEVEYE